MVGQLGSPWGLSCSGSLWWSLQQCCSGPEGGGWLRSSSQEASAAAGALQEVCKEIQRKPKGNLKEI